MPLNLFYTMVQKSQKWPKTQIKGGGGGPALTRRQLSFVLQCVIMKVLTNSDRFHTTFSSFFHCSMFKTIFFLSIPIL